MASPWFVTVIVTDRPLPDGSDVADLRGERPTARDREPRENGQDGDRHGDRDEHGTVDLPDATSRSPSGLHSSHRPTPGGTGLPHRAHGWVGSTETGERGAEAVGVTRRWCHETGRSPAPGASVTSG